MEIFLRVFQQLVFAILLGATAYLLYKRVSFIRRNILMGIKTGPFGNKDIRLKNMLMLAFGQKKMFDKPFVGLMHFVVYAGFLIINIEVLEIVLDGLIGSHRLFYPVFGNWYAYLIGFFELVALGVLVSCVIFLLRRNIFKVKRLNKIELKGWPKLDANVILWWEIVLMILLFSMNASDTVLQERAAESIYVSDHYPNAGKFLISGFLTPLFDNFSTNILLAIERLGWWMHIIGIMLFAIYVTYSKHLHIGLAFP